MLVGVLKAAADTAKVDITIALEDAVVAVVDIIDGAQVDRIQADAVAAKPTADEDEVH